MLTLHMDPYSECVPIPIIAGAVLGAASGCSIGGIIAVYNAGTVAADFGAGIAGGIGCFFGTTVGIKYYEVTKSEHK